MAELVRLEGVIKGYREAGRERLVLQGASARFVEGEVVAVRGRSGSGKTTLLNLIAGIDLPNSGEITVGGVMLTALDARQRTLFRRDNIGFIFQFFNLIPTLTVLENVLLPSQLAGAGQQALGRARDLLDRVELLDRAGQFPDRLSGGEQQRVAIARALIHRPRLVLADEPTGNLDAKTGAAVLALLDELTRQHGNTLILITHSRRVASYADRVFSLESGRLVLESEPAASFGAT